MLKISNVKIRLSTREDEYAKVIASIMNVRSRTISNVKLIKRSIDARRKDIFYICTFVFDYSEDYNYYINNRKFNIVLYNEKKYQVKSTTKTDQVVIVGSGPAGLFCALTLAYAGMKPIVIERGKTVDKRKQDIKEFWETGVLNTESNVQFGEGGAGTFSDGKLTTNIKDIRSSYILEEFVKAGAPKDILYDAKAHIGTDYLETVVANMRETIIQLGGTFMFETTYLNFKEVNGAVKSIKIKHKGEIKEVYCDHLVLAIGHSARDTYHALYNDGIAMERKPFAVGVRVEHLQSMIDINQYGSDKLPLKAADYKLAYHDKKGRGVFTFCMCPGGYVVASSSEENGLVTNGMSEYARDGSNANSAVLVSVLPSDFEGDDVFAGMKFQIELEKKAFMLGGSNYYAPVQLVDDFINKKQSTSLGKVIPTYTPGTKFVNLWELFPRYMADALKDGLIYFNDRIKGFTDNGAIMTAVESRSSSPVRIVRNELMQTSIANIYPIGEGAGAAGGIMTSAIDGIKCADVIIEQ